MASLARADFPALYSAADASSMRAQRHFLALTRTRLTALVVAAIGGAFRWIVGEYDLFGWLALLAFIVALVCQFVLLAQRPERTWYEGRAAAESTATLTWRYVVGGEPFGVALPRDVDNEFTRRVHSILWDLRELAMEPAASEGSQITDSMRQLRAQTLPERKGLYESARIAEQQRWYSHRSQANTKQARMFGVLSALLDGIGIIGATLKAFGVFEIDILGIVAAFGGALGAWVQAKQYETLGRAYFIASQELATIRSRISEQHDEASWARFVEESEKAISREHTLWRAARVL